MTAVVAVPVLVVGYGNPLRGDDGAGPAIAGRIGTDPRFAGADVRVAHQLTPELARDIADAGLVVLVDASEELPPGTIAVRRVDASPGDGSAWSHHVDPEGLAGLALALYGAVPPVFAVGVGAGSMETGEHLSAAVASAMPAAVEAVHEIVREHGHA